MTDQTPRERLGLDGEWVIGPPMTDPTPRTEAAWCEACGYAHDAHYADCAALLNLSEHEYLLHTNAYYRAGWDRAAAQARTEALDYRYQEPFTYRSSWPGGQRWTVVDGSGYDDDVFIMFDTEPEAAAAVAALERFRAILAARRDDR